MENEECTSTFLLPYSSELNQIEILWKKMNCDGYPSNRLRLPSSIAPENLG
jgi:transposase